MNQYAQNKLRFESMVYPYFFTSSHTVQNCARAVPVLFRPVSLTFEKVWLNFRFVQRYFLFTYPNNDNSNNRRHFQITYYFWRNHIDSVWIVHSCVDLPSHNKEDEKSRHQHWYAVILYAVALQETYTYISELATVLSADEKTEQKKCVRMVLQQRTATKDDDSNGGNSISRSCSSSSSIKIYYQLNEQ